MEIDPTVETIPDRTQLGAALRELENAKARVERDARQVADETKKKLVSQLLPVMDNLDRTIKAATDSGDAPAVIEGITLVKGQLETVLRGYGVERIDAAGTAFDPAIHEAVTTLPVLTTEAHNLIVDQLAPGYRFGTQLLRPAQVVVGKLSQAPQPPQVEPEPEPVAPPRRPIEPQRPIETAPRAVPARPEATRYVDQYGRPVDQYGRQLRAQQFDAYGRPVQFDRYGRPVQPQGWSPFARRFR